MQHARTTLRKIFAATLRPEGHNAPLLAWPLACGLSTAEKTTAVSFADGVLTIVVPDKTWRLQLQDLSLEYLSALNQISPERVSQIKFITRDESRQ